MQSLCFSLTNILLNKIRKARFVIRYFVALTCDLQLLAYDTQVLPRDEAKNNIFSPVDFSDSGRERLFFFSWGIISNRLFCSNEMAVLTFSLKKEKTKKQSREDHFIRRVAYRRKVLEPNLPFSSPHSSSNCREFTKSRRQRKKSLY